MSAGEDGGKCKCTARDQSKCSWCQSLPDNYPKEQQPAAENPFRCPRCKHLHILGDCKVPAAESETGDKLSPAEGVKPLSTKPFTWKSAALSAGEHFASVGPTMYYSMTPGQWLAWVQDEVAYKDRRIAELETQARSERWLVGEQHRPGCVRPYTCDCFYESKIADLERRNAELEWNLTKGNENQKASYQQLLESGMELAQQKADLERQMKEAKEFNPYSSKPCSLCEYHEGIHVASCGYHNEIRSLEQRLKDATDVRLRSEREIAELKWKLSDFHAREGLMKVKAEELEQQVRELKHILSVIHEEDLLPMAFALDGGKEIRDVVKEIVKENP